MWLRDGVLYPGQAQLQQPLAARSLGSKPRATLSGVGRIRTDNILLAKQALYHWSYYPVVPISSPNLRPETWGNRSRFSEWARLTPDQRTILDPVVSPRDRIRAATNNRPRLPRMLRWAVPAQSRYASAIGGAGEGDRGVSNPRITDHNRTFYR